MTIDKVIKGEFRPRDEITVSILGGRVSFEEGNMAEVKPLGAVMPSPNARYLFFLGAAVDPSAEQLLDAKGVKGLDEHGLVGRLRAIVARAR